MRVDELRAVDDPRALSFPKLVNFSSREGISSLGSQTEIDLFYPKAWVVVDHLMKQRREPFFAYIRHVRDPANEATLEDTDDFALLSRFLGVPEKELQSELDVALRDRL
jgi:hypothetical protein